MESRRGYVSGYQDVGDRMLVVMESRRVVVIVGG